MLTKVHWIILDRDGVINHDSDAYIKSPEEWGLIEGSSETIAQLNTLALKVAVMTHQSGIVRDYYSLETLNLIHDKMLASIESAGGKISYVYFSSHCSNDQCECHKPFAGLFSQFATEYQVNLKQVCAVGDSARDLEAATSAGCIPVLVKTGKGTRSLATIDSLEEGHWLKNVLSL